MSNRRLLLGKEAHYRCATPREVLAAREGIEPSSTRFKGGAPIPIQSAWQWCRRVESNHQGLSTTGLQPAEPTALLNAGMKIGGTEGNRTLITRLQGGSSPVELRPRILVEPPRIELGSPVCETGALPLELWPLGGSGGNRTRDWTMPLSRDPSSPRPRDWCRSAELNRILLVFSETCNR